MKKETIELFRSPNHIKGYGHFDWDFQGQYPEVLKQKNIVKQVADIVFKKRMQLLDYNVKEDFIPNGEYYQINSDLLIPKGTQVFTLEVYLK